MTDIGKNLKNVLNQINAAEKSSNRETGFVRLVAVSKVQPIEVIEEAIKAGHRVFGENWVQEAREKYTPLKEKYPDIELHLIGALQTNKALDAVKLFDVIQTLDRPGLALEIAKAILKTGKTPRLYVEVNIGSEEQKAGVSPEELPDFLKECKEKHNLKISGLMCIPPANEDPLIYFNKMKLLAMAHDLPHLSMGMSSDFQSAIACGATEVRVGTAIFGERSKTKE